MTSIQAIYFYVSSSRPLTKQVSLFTFSSSDSLLFCTDTYKHRHITPFGIEFRISFMMFSIIKDNSNYNFIPEYSLFLNQINDINISYFFLIFSETLSYFLTVSGLFHTRPTCQSSLHELDSDSKYELINNNKNDMGIS